MKTSNKFFILMVLFLLITISLSAQARLDMSGNVPLSMGINFDGGNENIDIISNFLFIVPELDLHYFFELGPIDLGLGVRMYTLILESLMWPNILAELELGDFVISGEIGGGLFAFFGLFQNFSTSSIFLGDLSVAYKFNDWFRMGVGALGIMENDSAVQFSKAGVLPYVIYAFGKFSFEL